MKGRGPSCGCVFVCGGEATDDISRGSCASPRERTTSTLTSPGGTRYWPSLGAAAECGVQSSDDGRRCCVWLSLCRAGYSEYAGNIWLTAAIQWAANSPFRKRTTATTIGIGPINCWLATEWNVCVRINGAANISLAARGVKESGWVGETTAATARKTTRSGHANERMRNERI